MNFLIQFHTNYIFIQGTWPQILPDHWREGTSRAGPSERWIKEKGKFSSTKFDRQVISGNCDDQTPQQKHFAEKAAINSREKRLCNYPHYTWRQIITACSTLEASQSQQRFLCFDKARESYDNAKHVYLEDMGHRWGVNQRWGWVFLLPLIAETENERLILMSSTEIHNNWLFEAEGLLNCLSMDAVMTPREWMNQLCLFSF